MKLRDRIMETLHSVGGGPLPARDLYQRLVEFEPGRLDVGLGSLVRDKLLRIDAAGYSVAGKGSGKRVDVIPADAVIPIATSAKRPQKRDTAPQEPDTAAAPQEPPAQPTLADSVFERVKAECGRLREKRAQLEARRKAFTEQIDEEIAAYDQELGERERFVEMYQRYAEGSA